VIKRSGLMSNKSGSTALEFAIIVPVFLSLVIFMVEGFLQLLTGAVLQFGVYEASRFGITGAAYPLGMSASQPASREAAIIQIIGMYGLGLINTASASFQVTLTSYPSFGSTQGTPGAGGSGDVVVYQVSYFQPWIYSTSSTYPAVTATGLTGIQHTITMVSKNEAY
jgi:Flp pilus assembly protein TadG